MNASRSSNGRNADFIALIVTQRRSPNVHPACSTSSAASRDIEVPLINRLSVLSVTRNRKRNNREIGCRPMLRAAPVCRLLLGHISRGIRESRMYAASLPSRTVDRSTSS